MTNATAAEGQSDRAPRRVSAIIRLLPRCAGRADHARAADRRSSTSSASTTRSSSSTTAAPTTAREVLPRSPRAIPRRGHQSLPQLRLAERLHERHGDRDRRRRRPARRRPAGPARADREFYEKWVEGYDVVYGSACKREATVVPRRWPTRPSTASSARSSYVPIPLDAGDFSLIDRRS